MSEVLLRASSVRDCPRKAVYEATVPADREPTDRERRILWRGQSLGADYAKWLKAMYGPNAVWKEVKVKWPFGVGHIDIFLRPTKTAIEVLSSAHASDAMVQSKLLQLVLYLEHYPRAHNGCLIVLNPSDFTEERFPVAKDTDTYRGLVDEMRNRVTQLQHWRDTGELPPRVCRKPSDAIGHFCRHADTCFAGWVAPEPASVVDDPDAIRIAAALHHAKGEERAAQAVATEREQERKQLEKQLAALDGVDGLVGNIRIGPFVVKRTFVQRSPALDWKKARLAGVVNDELLAEFMKPGANYWTTVIERTETSGPVDFGDEAPWTDEESTAA